jgi:transposase
MLAVVVSDVEVEGEYQFERRMFGSNPEQLRALGAWLLEQEVEEVVMESTAQYWKPVWEALERYWKPIREKREGASRRSGTLHLAQAQSNRGRRGRKRDFADAERLVKRLVARELTLSFVPDAEQRLWRTVTHKKYQLRRERVRLHNQLESLLEEAHIKLSSLVSDLLGASARRMLKALADGETNPAALAALADQKLRATPEQLCDALGACTDLKPVYRRLLKMALEQLQFLEQQIGQLDQELATLLHPHQDAVQRLAEVPGLGVDSAQQIIAEVGPTAATFPSGEQLSSWVGACPGDEESTGVNYSHRSPKGNRHMRRILNQTANAATRMKGSIFDAVEFGCSATNSLCHCAHVLLAVAQRFVNLSAHPQPMQQHRQLARHRNHCPFLGVFSSSRGELLSPPPQITTFPKRSQNVVRPLHQQRS